MNNRQLAATINRYRDIIQRCEQRATEAYIAKDMPRYMVNMQKHKDATRMLNRLKGV